MLGNLLSFLIWLIKFWFDFLGEGLIASLFRETLGEINRHFSSYVFT